MTIFTLFWRHQILALVIGFIKLQNMVKKNKQEHWGSTEIHYSCTPNVADSCNDCVITTVLWDNSVRTMAVRHLVFKDFSPPSRNLTCHINRTQQLWLAHAFDINFLLRISSCKKSGNYRCFPEVFINALQTLPNRQKLINALIDPWVQVLQSSIKSPRPKQWRR